MDTAECQGVVGQIILNDSMVVRTCRWLTKRLSAKGGGGGKAGASRHSVFTVGCLTVSHTGLSCQPSGWLRLQSWTVVSAINIL